MTAELDPRTKAAAGDEPAALPRPGGGSPDRPRLVDDGTCPHCGQRVKGARGRRGVADEVVTRVVERRRGAATLQEIADELNRDGVPTSQGGSAWRPSSVRAVLERAAR